MSTGNNLIEAIGESVEKHPNLWDFVKGFDVVSLKHSYLDIVIELVHYNNSAQPSNYIFNFKNKYETKGDFNLIRDKSYTPNSIIQAFRTKQANYIDKTEIYKDQLYNNLIKLL